MSRRVVVMFAILAAIAVGLAVYAVHLKRKVARDAQLAAQQKQEALAPVTSGPPTAVTLYVASDNDGALRRMQVNATLPPERTERARAVLRILFAQYLQSSSQHPIGTGADVRDVYLMGDDTAVVDTNAAFADAHPAGVLAEELTVASIVVTLNANDSKIARVKILVNGQERETLAGHADLRRFYEASNIGQVVKDLQVTLPRIGVFDSGVGGLTVLKAMAEQLPAHYLYFGDTARLPYGTKSAETVARYAIGATRFLEEQNIDLLVIACNTATALAFPRIQEAAHVPVVGVVEPGAEMAAEVSKNGSAIVIATEATVSSHAYRDALARHGLSSYEKACPLFVPLVEEGWIEHPVTEQVARIYLGEALEQAPQQADVLVLACTHYPLIAPLLRRIAPSHMQIVDSAESTARAVNMAIEKGVICHPAQSEDLSCHPERSEGVSATERSRRTPVDTTNAAEHRTFRFYVTDSTDKFKRLAARFLGRQVDHVEHVDLGG